MSTTFILEMLKRFPLQVIVLTGVVLAAGSAYSQFVLTPVPGLPAVSSGSVAWGDYDSDGRLDLLLPGTDGNTGAPHLSLWRNTGGGFTNVLIPGWRGYRVRSP